MNTDPPNVESNPGRSIETIESSLRCFGYSLVGLLPLIGIPFSVAAMFAGRKAWKSAKTIWNPADRYLAAGRRLAPLGLLTTVGFLVLVCFVIPAVLQGLASCRSSIT